MKLTYFITGASGFIGRPLCRRLIENGHRVKALVRKKNVFLASIGVEQIIGDLTKQETYRDCLADVNVVIHLGGDPRFGNGKEYYAINTEATKNLVTAIEKKSNSFNRFVFVSTLGVADRNPEDTCILPITEDYKCTPTTDYGKSKLLAESVVSSSSLPWSIIRPTPVVGEEMRLNSHVAVFVNSVLNNSPISWFKWTGGMSVVHVDDLVDALILASYSEEAKNRIFFAAGNKITIGEIFNLTSERKLRIPVSFFAAILRFSIKILPIIPYKIKSLFLDSMVVNDNALRSIGWMPKHDSKISVREVISAQKRRKSIMYSVKGYTLITGAASGLGASLAEKMQKLGRRLILVDKDRVKLDATLPNGTDIIRISCDLSDEKSFDELINMEFWRAEGVDEVIACAGIGARGLSSDLSMDIQSKVIKINLESAIKLCQQSTSFMVNRNFGRIVLISSSSAFQPLAYMAAYAASKAGLLSYGEALWAEMNDKGIRVLNVCPGGMKTNFQQSAGVKVLANEKLDTPDQVANEIIKQLDFDKCTLVVGNRAKAMSLISRVLPRKISASLWLKLMGSLR